MRDTLTLSLAAALILVAAACDGSGGSSPDVVPVDTVASETAPADATDPGAFACGALDTCGAAQACASRGQGACAGLPPNEHGQCAPNCAPYYCGGGDHCLCDTYWCVDLPARCATCGCAPKPDPSCECDDADGQVRFACMGA